MKSKNQGSVLPPAPVSASGDGYYIAELVHECRVEGYKTRWVWVNIHLVLASSAEEAYRRARALGTQHNQSYLAGDDERKAQWRFRGLRELVPVYESLGDGAEIMFENRGRMTEAGIRKLFRPKRELTAFRLLDET